MFKAAIIKIQLPVFLLLQILCIFPFSYRSSFQIFSFLFILGGKELIFSNFKDIRHFKYGSSNYTVLLDGLENVRNIAYDYRLGHLFYNLETIIKRTNIHRLNKSSVVIEARNENNLYGMAVDWVTQKLYFTDEETNHVEVCRYDGKYRRVLVPKGLDQPRGIALLPQKG